MQNSIFFFTILQSWKKKSLPSKFQFTEFQHKQFINVSFCVWTASKKTQFYSKKVKLLNFLKKIYIFGFTFIIGKNFLTKLWILTSKYILPRNDLSLHCTDFFLETKNRSYCLHCLEVVEVQMEVKMMSEVVSLQANHLWHHRDLHDLHDLQTMETIRSHFCFEKNPYNVSSNLSLSRAHFSKVHVFCEVVEVMEVMEVV